MPLHRPHPGISACPSRRCLPTPGALLLQFPSCCWPGVPALAETPGLATTGRQLPEEYFTSIPFCLSREDQQAARTHPRRGVRHHRQGQPASLSARARCTSTRNIWILSPSGMTAPTVHGRVGGPGRVRLPVRLVPGSSSPLLGRRGFLAWDISGTLGLFHACACGAHHHGGSIRQLSQYWVEQATAFHSGDEYAVDRGRGAAYWELSALEASRTPSPTGIRTLRLVRDLLGSKQAWCGRDPWPRPTGKKPQTFRAGNAASPERIGTRPPPPVWLTD